MRPGTAVIRRKQQYLGGGRSRPIKGSEYEAPRNYSETYCGEVGRQHDGRGTTWSRITSKLHHVTCEHCLVALIHDCKKALHDRVAVVGKPVRGLVREAHGKAVVRALDELVNAS